MSQQLMADLATQMVLAVAPHLANDRPGATRARDFVVREIKKDAQGGTRREWEDVEHSLRGLAEAARIRVQDDLGEAMGKVAVDLQDHRRRGLQGWEGDMLVKMSNIPQHIQLLLNLANRPNTSTHAFAHDYLNRQPYTGPCVDELLYREIMSEPFEGDYWRPDYDRPEELNEGWTESESSDTLTSDDDEEIVTSGSEMVSVSKADRARLEDLARKDEADKRLREAKMDLERLSEGAYWRRPGGTTLEPMLSEPQGWREVTTARTLSLSVRCSNEASVPALRVITAQQLQRELLYALSGRPGVLFEFNDDGHCSLCSDRPAVGFFSEAALTGLLDYFCRRATQLSTLRCFITDVLSPVASTSSPALSTPGGGGQTKTKQAFAEACRNELAKLSNWVAGLEMEFTSGRPGVGSRALSASSAASSPLLLKLELDSSYGGLIDHLTSLLAFIDSPTILLNALYTFISSISSTSAAEIADALLRIFVASAEPVWAMLGDWLHRGMPIPTAILDPEGDIDLAHDENERLLDSEFFIRRDRDVSWADEDFWEAAFVDGEDGWPSWLGGGEVRELLMEAGKAVGLLRGLTGSMTMPTAWRCLSDVLGVPSSNAAGTGMPPRSDELDISDIIRAYLAPVCSIAMFQLRRTLEDDCGLLEHLDAIDGILYIRVFGVMESWSSWLFQQIRTCQRWSDFQILTSTLRDAIEQNDSLSIHSSAVRVSSTQRTNGEQGVRAISAIKIDYQVPFPLSQLFTPTSMELRSDVFTFCLQLLYARRSVIDISDTRSKLSSVSQTADMTNLQRLRQRLGWVLNTLWIWLSDRVIGLRTIAHRERLSTLTSLRSMIALELAHSRRIREFCFLHETTANVNAAVFALFDMPFTLKECFYACHRLDAQPEQAEQGDTLPIFVQGCSRRRRRRALADDTSDDSDGELHPKDQRSGKDAIFYQRGMVEEGNAPLGGKIQKLRESLEEQVMLLKEGVEVLGSSGGHDAELSDMRSTWEMLSFALEDWK